MISGLILVDDYSQPHTRNFAQGTAGVDLALFPALGCFGYFQRLPRKDQRKSRIK